MALSDFPNTFGICELKKGFFHHFFNLPANQHYIGPIPSKDMYGPHSLSLKKRREFDTWFDEHLRDPNYVFYFQHELKEYCLSDVKRVRNLHILLILIPFLRSPWPPLAVGIYEETV